MGSVKHTNLSFKVNQNIQSIHLPLETRRNIYLIFKEAIHNSMKYSQATSMEMMVHSFDHSIEMVWMDNGIGFELPVNKNGHGLGYMQQRADEIGARLELKSASMQGTKISIQCKIPH